MDTTFRMFLLIALIISCLSGFGMIKYGLYAYPNLTSIRMLGFYCWVIIGLDYLFDSILNLHYVKVIR